MHTGIRSVGPCGLLTRVLCSLLLAGCTSADDAFEDDVTITRENGVTIVTSAGVHIADTLSWRIDTTDVVRIGVVDGPEEYMIGRLAGMLVRPNSEIVIADAFARLLRVYDEHGTFLRSVGGPGEGPGEFGALSHLLPHTADSVIVVEGEGSRATVLDPDLRFVRRFHPRLRETRARPPMTSHSLEGFFDDGSTLMSDYIPCASRSEGFCEDSVAFFRTSEDGTTLARFGTFVYSRGESHRVVPGSNVGWSEPHAQALWRLHDNRLYYADARRIEVRIFSSDGRLERIARVAAEQQEYERDELFTRWPAATDPRRQESARVYNAAIADAEVPDSLPFFSDMLVDATGHIWLREYWPPGGHAPPARWLILDPEGRLRYAVRTPLALMRAARPYIRRHPQIGDDYVLASQRDTFGVESVVRYRLLKR